jgi:hypothetical protein
MTTISLAHAPRVNYSGPWTAHVYETTGRIHWVRKGAPGLSFQMQHLWAGITHWTANWRKWASTRHPLASFDSEGVAFLVAVYLDDNVLGGRTKAKMNAVKVELSLNFEMKHLRPLHYFYPSCEPRLLAAISQLGPTISDWNVKLLGLN